MIRWALYVAGALAVIALLILGTGMLLPKAHVAAVQAHYQQPPERIYAAIVDVANGPSWRTGLDSVLVLSAPGEPVRWREYASWGTITFVRDEEAPPSRVVGRIADIGQGFGGRWTYEIVPDENGSVLTITEHGEVYSPLYRFMSRFIFGHYRSLETYAQDLARKFSDDVEIERISGH